MCPSQATHWEPGPNFREVFPFYPMDFFFSSAFCRPPIALSLVNSGRDDLGLRGLPPFASPSLGQSSDPCFLQRGQLSAR